MRAALYTARLPVRALLAPLLLRCTCLPHAAAWTRQQHSVVPRQVRKFNMKVERNLPAVPSSGAVSHSSWDAAEASRVRESLTQAASQADAARQLSKDLSRVAFGALEDMQRGDVTEGNAKVAACTTLLQAFAAQGLDRVPLREINTQGFEDLLCAAAFSYFLVTGAVLPLAKAGDALGGWHFLGAEYVGACCALCQELTRYSIGRAAAIDKASVDVAHANVAALSAQLQLIDFRNGPLRRKYDGVKYSARRLEDIRFQLSLVGDGVAADAPDGEGLLSVEEFTAIREEMEHTTDRREGIIKRTRDVQRASKNSVSALLRGDLDGGAALLTQAAARAREILPDLAVSPELRHGAFSASMEEYAEGMILAHWLRTGQLPTCASLEIVNDAEYMGGVLDFTGEVNRYGIAQATKRNIDAVMRCLEVVTRIQSESLQMRLDEGFYGNSLGRKLNPLAMTYRKLQSAHLELCLRAASGWAGSSVGGVAEEEPPPEGS